MSNKISFALALAIALPSCTSTGSFDPAKMDDLVAKIQAYTAATCAVLPQAASVVALVSAFYPEAAIAATAVSTIGNAICQGQPAMSIRKGATYAVRIVTAPNGKRISVRYSPAR